MKRLEAKVFGFVQGISYRSFVANEARALWIFGTVENLPDDVVLVVAEGERQKLLTLLGQLKSGYRYAKVEQVEEKWSAAIGAFSDFRIIL